MQFLTLETLKRKIGKLWLRREYAIESDLICRYTKVVDDDNPRWQGVGAEVPPVMLPALSFGSVASTLRVLGTLILHGASDLEIYLPVRDGDDVTVTTAVASLRVRKLRSGISAFITFTQNYSNQRGEKIASCTQLTVLRLDGSDG